MKQPIKYKVLAIALANIFAVGAAQATNGYFSEGTGAKNRGLGGAGTALAQEAGSIVMNPAAAVNMGSRIDVGVGLFSPSPRSYTISDNDIGLDGSADSTMDYFLIPFYGQNFVIDDQSSWAVTINALGGMNTDYEQHPFESLNPNPATPFGALGIDLKQVSIGGTYAMKVNDRLSVGATLSLIIQQFQAKGLQPFAGLSVDPTKLTNNGKSRSTGIGLNFGATYEASDSVTVAFAYAPKADMSEFDEYAGLFAEGGDFDIPSNYTLGVAWQLNSDTLVSMDLRRINYTDVAAVSNDAQRLTDFPTSLDPATFSCGAARQGGVANLNSESRCLGGANGAGFGWDDMTVIKLGVAWSADSDTVYRAGWNHGSSPIKAEDAVINIIAPAVVEDHLSLGMTKKLDSSSEITVDFIHTFANDVTGNVPAAFSSAAGGNPTPSPGTATIAMEQNFIEVQYGKRF